MLDSLVVEDNMVIVWIEIEPQEPGKAMNL